MNQHSATPADESVNAIGRTEHRREVILTDRVAALAATLDLPQAPEAGSPLPAGWHWLFFNPFVRRSEIGADGHPRRGGFMPDTGLPRRMWAGGRLKYLAPLPIGAEAEKQSEIVNVVAKSGRTGRLVFVTVRHRISAEGALCVKEEQDIVYREAPLLGAPAPEPTAAPEGADWSVEVQPDAVMLFRYSALTSNGHRIHYDQPYATGEEGYPGLVVHGPLVATLLQGFAISCQPGKRLTGFTFRGVAPLFVDEPFCLQAAPGDGALSVWARGAEGALAMTADATFQE